MANIEGELIAIRIAENKKPGGEVVGVTVDTPAEHICFFRTSWGPAVGERWLATVIRDFRNGTKGHLFVRLEQKDAGVASSATRTPERPSVAESVSIKVVPARPAVTVRVGDGKYTVVEGHWYFFPVGRRHNRFAVCRWPHGAEAPLIDADELDGYHGLVEAVLAARAQGYIVWWPEKWQRTGQGIEL